VTIRCACHFYVCLDGGGHVVGSLHDIVIVHHDELEGVGHFACGLPVVVAVDHDDHHGGV